MFFDVCCDCFFRFRLFFIRVWDVVFIYTDEDLSDSALMHVLEENVTVSCVKWTSGIKHKKHHICLVEEGFGAFLTRDYRVIESGSIDNFHSLQILFWIINGNRLGYGDILPIRTNIFYKIVKGILLSLPKQCIYRITQNLGFADEFLGRFDFGLLQWNQWPSIPINQVPARLHFQLLPFLACIEFRLYLLFWPISDDGQSGGHRSGCRRENVILKDNRIQHGGFPAFHLTDYPNRKNIVADFFMNLIESFRRNPAIVFGLGSKFKNL